MEEKVFDKDNSINKDEWTFLLFLLFMQDWQNKRLFTELYGIKKTTEKHLGPIYQCFIQHVSLLLQWTELSSCKYHQYQISNVEFHTNMQIPHVSVKNQKIRLETMNATAVAARPALFGVLQRQFSSILTLHQLQAQKKSLLLKKNTSFT